MSGDSFGLTFTYTLPSSFGTHLGEDNVLDYVQFQFGKKGDGEGSVPYPYYSISGPQLLRVGDSSGQPPVNDNNLEEEDGEIRWEFPNTGPSAEINLSLTASNIAQIGGTEDNQYDLNLEQGQEYYFRARTFVMSNPPGGVLETSHTNWRGSSVTYKCEHVDDDVSGAEFDTCFAPAGIDASTSDAVFTTITQNPS